MGEVRKKIYNVSGFYEHGDGPNLVCSRYSIRKHIPDCEIHTLPQFSGGMYGANPVRSEMLEELHQSDT